eukprot:TRINITY_DN16146_c0_g1_i1.p4 TRINITY_DN16146_c0_g1~~TRINITY_DN16146_c0_g1_i1.p4  ORF type:complete len:116 (-),score=1.79 TRINITY_DN16146_c0_g1_i1:117-464(-)
MCCGEGVPDAVLAAARGADCVGAQRSFAADGDQQKRLQRRAKATSKGLEPAGTRAVEGFGGSRRGRLISESGTEERVSRASLPYMEPRPSSDISSGGRSAWLRVPMTKRSGPEPA